MPRATPLLFVATMLSLGVAIEAIGFGSVAWLPKLPLATLLSIAFLRSRSPAGRE